MRNDDIIIVLSNRVVEELPEQGQIIVVDIKVYRYTVSKGFDKCIVNDFFVWAQFIEHQKDPGCPVYINTADKISFAWNGTDNALCLQVLVTLLCGIPANFKMKTQLIDGRKNIPHAQLTILDGLGNAVRELLVLGRNRKFIKVDQLKKKRCFHFC
jgi:hypothetical protein